MVVEVVAGLFDPFEQFPQFIAVDVHVDVDHSDGGVGHGAGDVGVVWFDEGLLVVHPAVDRVLLVIL